MPYSIKLSPYAAKQFNKLDRQTQQYVSNYMDKILVTGNPCDFGKALAGKLSGLWRYRVGKYRIICEINDDILVVEVINIDKRDKVYL